MSNSNHGASTGQRLDGFYAALRRPGIVRSTSERWFAGVSTGIARWLGVDPLVVRAGFILLSIFFGVGVGLYLVLWLLMPDDRGQLSVERALRDGEGGSIFLLVITVMSLLGGGPWWGEGYNGLRVVGFGLLVAAAWWFLTRTDTGRDLMETKPWRGGGSSTGNAAANAGATQFAPGSVVAPGSTPTTPAPAPWATTGSAATGGSPGAWPPPAAPTAPLPPEPRERVRGIPFAPGLLALGLALITGVVAHQVALAAAWPGSAVAVGIAASVGVLGLVIVVAGLAGRRAGTLSFIAVVGMVAALAVTAAPSGLTRPFTAGESRHEVRSLAGADDYQLSLGEMVVDLTMADVAATPANPDVVTATVGAGQLDIVVPQGVGVTVNAHARVGEVTAPSGTVSSGPMAPMMSEGRSTRGGTDVSATFTFGPADATQRLTVDAEVGLGQINVRTAS
ncbi:MAG: PspC domain protein [Humibacillus sp.]|nr:PspC domain protein [Humibacillus sp.]